MGFLSFRVAVAMLIATLALVELLRRQWSYALFALYAGAVLLDYLMHLSPIIFLFAALGVTGVPATVATDGRVCGPKSRYYPGARRHWGGTSPSACTTASPRTPSRAPMSGAPCKAIRPHRQRVLHFVPYTDVLLVAILAASLFARTGIPRWRDLGRPLVLEMLVLTALFVAAYFALPIGYAKPTTSTPVRCRSPVSFHSCLPRPTALGPDDSPTTEALAFALAALLAVGNLVYLARHFFMERAWVAQYRMWSRRFRSMAGLPRLHPWRRRLRRARFCMYGYVSMDRAAVEP